MGLFSKKSLTSDEYSDLSAKIVKLTSDIQLLKAESERVEERLRSFHGRLTKRIKEQEEDEDDAEQPQDLATIQRRLLGMPD